MAVDKLVSPQVSFETNKIKPIQRPTHVKYLNKRAVLCVGPQRSHRPRVHGSDSR